MKIEICSNESGKFLEFHTVEPPMFLGNAIAHPVSISIVKRDWLPKSHLEIKSVTVSERNPAK